MKRLMSMVLCILSIASAAFAEQVTLTELKQQTPERLQFELTTNSGETIIIDSPIIMPDGETMPIVLVKLATFDTSDLHIAFPENTQVSKEDAKVGSTLLNLFAEEKKNRLYGKVDSIVRAYLPQGEKPPENDVTAEEIMAFIYENIERFDCDMEPDIRVIKAKAKTGLYSMKRITTPEGYKQYTVDEKNPVKNGSKGAWDLTLAQYMYGVRIFHDHYYASDDGNVPDASNYWYSPFWFVANYLDEKHYNIHIRPAKEIGILVEDAHLLSYEDMVTYLQKRMKEGKLKSVYQLTLGYAVRIVKGDVFSDGYDFNDNARYVLVPEWQLLGYDTNYASSAKSRDVEELTKEMILEPELYSLFGHGEYELRIDAATGEYITHPDAQEFDLSGWNY